MNQINITEKELEILGHTIGIPVYNALRSKKKKDRTLPKKYYRNYFNAGPGHDDMPTLIDLINKGLMEQNDQDSKYYHVSDIGIKEFESAFKEAINIIK